MLQRRTLDRWLAGGLTVGLLLTGCSPAASPSGSAGGTSPIGTAGAERPTPSVPGAGGHGGTLSIAYSTDIAFFDPAKAYDVVSQPASRLIYEAILGYDSGTKLVPLLADGMPTISADGKVYTIKLRTGVKFVKPDGSVLRDMNADDVVASLNRVLDPNLKPSASPVAGAFFGNIVGAADVIGGKAQTASGIKKIDEATVEIDLVTADATFLNILASSFASVLPKETSHDAAELANAPVGTGPFTLKEYTKGSQATFIANKSYWQEGQPAVDEIDFRVGVDNNAAIQQIQADQLDLMGDPMPAGAFTQVTTDPKLKDQVISHTLVSTDYLFFDTHQPNDGPLSKAAVRQALEYAIDKESLLKLLHGTGVEANCILPPDMPGYDPNCHPYTFDPAKARQMLADAGYPNGFESTIYTDTADPDPQIAQALQQDLAAVGVKVNVVTEEFATLLDRLYTPHKAPMGFIGWFQDYPDPSDFIDPILSCATAVQGGSNAAGYCNKTVDALAVKARQETDPATRLQEYQQIQNMIMADAPWVPLRHQVWFTLVSTRVAGFQLHPVWLYDLRNVALKPGS